MTLSKDEGPQEDYTRNFRIEQILFTYYYLLSNLLARSFCARERERKAIPSMKFVG